MARYEKASLMKLHKDELVKKFLDFQDVNDGLKQKLDMVNEKVDILSKQMAEISKNKLSDNDLEMVNANLVQRVVRLEKASHNSQQYSRRDTVEICGIPSSVSDGDLEETVIQILDKVDVTATPNDIQACHRLHDKTRTIIKFVNRKHAYQTLTKKKTLTDLDKRKLDLNPNHKLYINDSLCPYFRMLHAKCKSLYMQNKIHSFWVANGSVRYKMEEDGPFTIVDHIDDLTCKFGEIEFYKP